MSLTLIQHNLPHQDPRSILFDSVHQKLIGLNLTSIDAQTISSFASKLFYPEDGSFNLPSKPIKFQGDEKTLKATVFKSNGTIEIYFHKVLSPEQKKTAKENKPHKENTKEFYRSIHLVFKNDQVDAQFSGLLKYKLLTPELSENFDHELKMLKVVKGVLQTSQLENSFVYFGRTQQQKCCKGHIYIDYCRNGDLENYIAKVKDLSSQQIYDIFESLLNALLSLNKTHILHNDLKPSNILLNHFLNCIIADFEFSLSKEDSQNIEKSRAFLMQKGTPLFLPPERLHYMEGASYVPSLPSNAWGIGCILYFLCKRNYPTICDLMGTYFDILNDIRNAAPNSDMQSLEEELKAAKDNIEKNLNDMERHLDRNKNLGGFEGIIKKLMHPNPKERLTPEQAIKLFERLHPDDFDSIRPTRSNL